MPITTGPHNVYAVFLDDDSNIVIRNVDVDEYGLPFESVVIPYDDIDDLISALQKIRDSLLATEGPEKAGATI